MVGKRIDHTAIYENKKWMKENAEKKNMGKCENNFEASKLQATTKKKNVLMSKI